MTIPETWNAIKNAKCQNDASRIRANRRAKNQRSKCIIHCHRKPTAVNETLWFIRWRASSKIQHLKRGEFYQKGLHGITNHKISYFVYSNARNHHLFFTTNALCLYFIERYFVSVGLKAISTTCLFGEVNVVNGAWRTVCKCVYLIVSERVTICVPSQRTGARKWTHFTTCALLLEHFFLVHFTPAEDKGWYFSVSHEWRSLCGLIYLIYRL